MRIGSPLLRLSAATASALFVIGSAAVPAVAGEGTGPGLAPVEQVVEPTPAPEPTSDPEPTETAEPTAEPTDGAPGEDPAPEEPTAPADDPLEPADPTDPAPADPTDPDPAEPNDPAPAEPTEEPTDEPGPDDPADPAEPVEESPEPIVLPAVSPTVVDGAAGYVLPDLAGVTWLVDGTPLAELVAAGAEPVDDPDELTTGSFEVTTVSLGREIETVVLAAVAADGHLLATEDDGTSTVRYVVDPRVPVELVPPSAADGDGREEDAVVVPEAPGQVVRDAAGTVLGPSTHPVAVEYAEGTATVELTVEAAAGHRLDVDGVPLETVPGAGGVWHTTLTFTDPGTPADDAAEIDPAPPADPGTDDTPDPQPEPEPDLLPGQHVVTVDHTSEPAVQAVQETADPEPVEAAAERPTERLSDSGPRGVDLMVIMSLVFIGGAWLVLGVGRDAR